MHEAKLYELGPVLGAAYADTSVAIRSMIEGLPDELRAHLLDGPTNPRDTVPAVKETYQMSTHADRQRIAQYIRREQRERVARARRAMLAPGWDKNATRAEAGDRGG